MNFGMLTQAVYTPALTFLCKLARACVRVHKDLHSQTHTGHQAGPETHVLAQQNRDSHQMGWGCLLGKLEMESPRQGPSDDQGFMKLPLLSLGSVILYSAGSLILFLFFLEHQSWLRPG